jgi:hypothetical protein
VDPEVLAYRDRDEFVVESIVDHDDNGSHMKSKWEFLVRWQGYPPDEDRWLSWRQLRDNPRLHEYLRTHGFARFIPREHRAHVDDHA